jgi:hypothetical protein
VLEGFKVVNKSTKWTKRKIFTYAKNGKPRRMLLWRKGIYEAWFEYARTAQKYGYLIPPEFGDLSQFDFDRWWNHPDYGFELFCEPVVKNVVQVIDEVPDSISDKHLLVDIDLNHDQDRLIALVTSIIKKKQGKEVSYVSKARFKPSKPPRHIKLRARQAILEQKRVPPEFEYLRKYLNVWKQDKENVAHKDIAKKMKMLPPDRMKKMSPDTYETATLSALRKLSRYKRAVNASFKNISNGTFP